MGVLITKKIMENGLGETLPRVKQWETRRIWEKYGSRKKKEKKQDAKRFHLSSFYPPLPILKI